MNKKQSAFMAKVKEAAQASELHKENLDIKADYSDYITFLTEDKKAGFAINKKTRELTNVFSLEKGRGKELLEEIRKYTDLKLDCFDGYLVDFYKKAGFAVTSQVPNWTAGQPDVVFMAQS